ncbi:hypothetical protein VIN01S_24860 [Vibrio inusitatus NBRC 102082]|uniref:Lipoprotein n=1 Tax=Vibrio inusitatus NBRC 102082 TaxID=1219070 RepID=A0A4Y3HYC2_9VIBR|nr:hypothetical protein [Vibrio inusitatus]GEA51682.1 hypothetical protein VIN01S_24860 [Vibrio inusitatus NBRC 102082]
MKYKLIALAVSGALLAACGSDNDNYVTPENVTVQAYDGGVRNIEAFYNCGDGDMLMGTTGGGGFLEIGLGNFPEFTENPDQCVVSFGPTQGAVDEVNSKDMSEVQYIVPLELYEPNTVIAATPYTTLINKRIEELEAAGEDVIIDDIIDDVFEDSLPEGTDLSDAQKRQLLSDPDAALASMSTEQSTNVQAATIALSDALVAQPNRSSEDLTNVTQTISTSLAADPDFPVNQTTGKPTYIDVSEDLKDETAFNDVVAQEPDPEEPLPDDTLQDGEELPEEPPAVIPPPGEEGPPPTGGTGGTTG